MKISVSVILVCFTALTASAQPVWVDREIHSGLDQDLTANIADIDGDGDLDILSASYNSDYVQWWDNLDGTGLNWSYHPIGSIDGARSSYAGDIDGDGDLDVVGAAYFDDDVIWWENANGNGTNWIEHTVDDNFNGVNAVYISDIDGDGDNDVIGGSWWNGFKWWENIDGDGRFWNTYTVSGTDYGVSVHCADVDSDGDIDVLGASTDNEKLFWCENEDSNGTSWIEHTMSLNSGDARDVNTIDIDSDGDIDIIGAIDHSIMIWENDGTNNINDWNEYTSGNIGGTMSVYAVDVNEDGWMDILSSIWSGTPISWWENDGTNDISNWLEHLVTEEGGEFGSVKEACSGDFDSDGDWDVLGASYDSITWWEQHYPTEILAPNGGEAWRIGTTHDIEWSTTADQTITLDLLDGENLERTLAEDIENSGILEWTIPNDIQPGQNYYIRCTIADGSEQDVSDVAFAITALPGLTLTPHLPPIIIPSQGNGFWYWVEISNHSPFSGTGHYWTEVVLPNGNTYGPLSVTPKTLEPWQTFAPGLPFPQWIPAYAPAGTYDFVMHVGIYPNLIVATDSFEFEKLAGTSTVSVPQSAWNVEDWRNEAWETTGAQVATQEPLPNEFSVSPAYPNPFNASISLTVFLPEPAELTVTVYDVLGREVAILANGQHSAGKNRLTFEASGLASGLYFVRATVPGHLDQVQKVMLVR